MLGCTVSKTSSADTQTGLSHTSWYKVIYIYIYIYICTQNIFSAAEKLAQVGEAAVTAGAKIAGIHGSPGTPSLLATPGTPGTPDYSASSTPQLQDNGLDRLAYMAKSQTPLPSPGPPTN